MKYISTTLTLLLVCLIGVSGQAQSDKKPTKDKAAQPAKQDNRPVAANPVVTGDPATKPDNRVVSATPVIEGDPMVPEDRITTDDLKSKIMAGASVMVLDVRSQAAWEASKTKIKGAIRLVPEDVEKKMQNWKKTQEIIAYCACPDDATSLSVIRTLKKAGFTNVKALWGGWQPWEQAGFPTEAK